MVVIQVVVIESLLFLFVLVAVAAVPAITNTTNNNYIALEHSWQFFARFLYGASVHLNLDRRTAVRLSNCVIAFNQSTRSDRFRRILYFISLRLKW